jgi:transcriptional regulator with XRE-family HTH domain
MPRIDDHPLRLARLRAGYGQIKLASLAGVNRSTISGIEENRVRTPTPETLRAIEQALNVPAQSLEVELTNWLRQQDARGPLLTPRARILLEQAPSVIAMFPSWVAWRKIISPTPTHFASLLGVNRQVVAGYEQGIRVHGMPEPLVHALLTVLRVNNDYLKVLQQLPPSED